MRIQSVFAKTAIATAFGFGVALGSITLADELPMRPNAANAQNQKATKVAAVPPAVAAAAKFAEGKAMRTVVVEWKIKAGREEEFEKYWAERSTIPNRDGLIAEFLSKVDTKWTWINWLGPINKPGITTYYNVGLWRDGDSFQDQIGKFIDNNRPSLDFEGEKRTRVLLAPQLWRVGETGLPRKDSDGTK